MNRHPTAYRLASIVLPLAGWLVMADSIYASGTGHPFAVWGWPHALKWFGPHYPFETACIVVSGLLPTAMLICYVQMMVRLAKKRRVRKLSGHTGTEMIPIERGITDNLGHAKFADIVNTDKSFSGPGTLIGANTRDEKTKFLYDDPEQGAGHWLAFAGPGSDKSTSLVTRLWLWAGPRVCFDPKCEIFKIMGKALNDDGFRVYSVDIKGNGINVLDWIDVNDGECDAHIRTAVNWIYNGGATPAAQQKNPFWTTNGKALVTCLMAHMLYSDVPEKTCRFLRRGITLPETQMMDLLTDIHATSESSYARMLAGTFMEMKAPETFSGIYSNAASATEWLSVDAYAQAVSGNAVRASDILDSDKVIFVQIPLRTLITTPTLGRAIMGALFNAVFQDDGATMTSRALFAIDEAWTLGPAEEIALAHMAGRSYQICVGTIWPSEAKMEEIWTKSGRQMLFETSNWRSYNAVQDGEVAERLSADMGEYAVMAYSEGDNTGNQRPRGWFGSLGSKSSGFNVNKHEIKRRLVKRDEIMRSRADQMFVLVRDFPYPLTCFTTPYFRYPWIDKVMQSSQFSLKFRRNELWKTTKNELTSLSNSTSGNKVLPQVENGASP